MKPEDKEIELTNLSQQQIEALRKAGFEVRVEEVYYHDCPFCGKHIEDKDVKRALRRFNGHLAKCKYYKFVKLLDATLPRGSRGGDIVFVLTGEFPKGYIPDSENVPMLELIRQKVVEQDATEN